MSTSLGVARPGRRWPPTPVMAFIGNGEIDRAGEVVAALERVTRACGSAETGTVPTAAVTTAAGPTGAGSTAPPSTGAR